MMHIDQRDVFADTCWRLEQWALWVITGQSSRQCAPFAHLLKTTSKGAACTLTDDQALEVDRLLARLKKRDYQTGSAVVRYFMNRQNVSSVARMLDVNNRVADLLIRSGIAWIDAHLHAEVI